MNSDKRKPSTLRAVGVLIFFALLMASLMSTCSGEGAMIQRINKSHSSRNVDTSAVAEGTLSDLNELAVNDNPTPPEKYNRVEQFGPAWKDVDHNGCDTRNDILARDLKTISDRRNTCVITAGQLADPYSGKWIDFRKKEASKVQIKNRYALTVTTPEKQALADALATCTTN